MPSKTSPKISDEERTKRIRDAAKEIGADATGKEFRRTFEKIVPAKPPPPDKARP